MSENAGQTPRAGGPRAHSIAQETRRAEAPRGPAGAEKLPAAPLLAALLVASACLPQPPGGAGRGARQQNVTLYAFSVMKGVMEKSIIPAFHARWQREHGVEPRFTASYAGSETITNQILQGVGAQIGVFSIERDVGRLAAGVPVFVTRPKPETNSAPLKAGDRVAVGLTSFRVLPSFALASERGGQIIDTEKK